jgi:hypothetical protein
MTDKALDKIPPGPKLDALTAEKVFGSSKKSGEKEWRVAKSSNHAKIFETVIEGQCPGRHACASMYASYGVWSLPPGGRGTPTKPQDQRH